MTGTPTLQPFTDDDNNVVALFNGEIYNYVDLAEELSSSSGSENKHNNMTLSDGYVLIPAYRKWGQKFINHLHGEYAIILVDFKENIVILSTDVFSTKPLWYGSFDCNATSSGKCFVAASYETGLEVLGVPASERHMAKANQVVVLSIASDSAFREILNYNVFDFDLNQYKNTTNDWQEAFVKAVSIRVTGIKHRLFIGLSSGYDSGAIMLALEMLQKELFAYHVKTKADSNAIIQQRVDFCHYATSVIIEVSQEQYRQEKEFLEKRCEPYLYQEKESSQYGFKVYEDKASIGLSLILQQVRKLGGLIYLSGSGADETISDYALNGKKIFKHSNFGGVFPTNLSDIFPWHSFYEGTQRDYLMKEEITGGAHGIETRYPFLDPYVVQEYLWLTNDIKNSEYKRPVADFLRSQNFPNMYGTKAGFSVTQENVTSIIQMTMSTATNASGVYSNTTLVENRKNINWTQTLTKSYSKTDYSIYQDYYQVLLSWVIIGIVGFRTYRYQAAYKVHVYRRMVVFAVAALALLLAFLMFQQKQNTSQLDILLADDQSFNRAHLVYAANEDQILGVYASVCSILTNTITPDAITFHFFLIQNDTSILNDDVFNAFQDYIQDMGAVLEVHKYSLSDVKPFINMKFKKQGYDLATPSNYVRFIISDKLPNADLCLWIDADTIVQGDIVPFMNDRDPTKAVSAFVRDKADIDENVRAKLVSRGVDLSPKEPTFNAGIVVINLKLWRETNASDALAEICKINDELSLWTDFGSQPPLQLLFSGDRFEHLSSTLYANGLGYIKDYELSEEAMFLHWNGKYKPWLENGLNSKYWLCPRNLTWTL